MNVDLDLNLTDFQIYGGFGLDKSYLTGFGFDNLVWNFYATASSVLEV